MINGVIPGITIIFPGRVPTILYFGPVSLFVSVIGSHSGSFNSFDAEESFSNNNSYTFSNTW